MGYDLHITRKDYWADPKGNRIEQEEWDSCVAQDSSLSKDPKNGEYDYLYTSGSSHPLWYDSDLGNVFTKNPDKPTIIKMVSVAKLLSAEVRGDDDELYESNGEVAKIPPSKNKPWWKLW